MKNKKNTNHVYIIAEIGQNHNGDIELAKKLIDVAAMPIFDHNGNRQLSPVDAVKFVKRDLSEELTNDKYNEPYNNPNSFGKTYGEHREKLEFKYEDFGELEKYAHSKGLDFIVTLCSPKTLQILDYTKIDYIKIASRDLTNIPLIEAVAKTKVPVILSRGMSGEKEIDNAIKIISKKHSKISLLHCVSEYPAQYSNLNLRAIQELEKIYGRKATIGYSDHSIGIVAPVLAVALGAKIIEKHITLNRKMKGSDHAGSLEIDGLWRMTRDIRNMEEALGQKKILKPNVSKETENKLRRSLAINTELKKGQILDEKMLCMISPGDGLRWEDKKRIIGKKAIKDIAKLSQLNIKMFQK